MNPDSPAPYGRFTVMIVVSTVIMFGLMYLNVYEPAHVHFSQTRFYMALVMGSVMAAVMLAFMQAMYADKRKNAIVLAVSVAVFALALALVRTQATVDDTAWMKAMIPHHSIAILTSERAHISDPRVRKLADSIIETQRKEIAEMEGLLNDLEQRQK